MSNRIPRCRVDRNFTLDINGNVHRVDEAHLFGHVDERFVGERINDGDDSLLRPTASISPSAHFAVDYHGKTPEIAGHYLPLSQER